MAKPLKSRALSSLLKVERPDMSPARLAFIDRRLPTKQAWQLCEHQLQRAVLAHLTLRLPQHKKLLSRFFAIPNGGQRNKQVAVKMRKEGQRRGVPDLFLPVTRPHLTGHDKTGGLWIELKKAGNSPTAEQWDWLNYLCDAGYAAHVCNDVNTTVAIVAAYLGER